MRSIAIVAGSAPSLINFRGELLEEMVSRGHRVHAIAPTAHPWTSHVIERLQAIGVGFVPLELSRRGANPIRDTFAIFKLSKIFRQLDVDTVFSYTPKLVTYGSIAASHARVPYVFSMVSGLGFAFSTTQIKASVVRAISTPLYRYALRYNNAVIFQNPDDMEFFSSKILGPHTRAVLVNGSGVNLQKYPHAPILSEMNFLLIARLIAEKGVREYVGAARMIKQIHPNAQFRIAGGFESGAHRITEDELESWVAEGTIEYLGELRDVRPAIRDATALILPTYYREGQPRSILEAMSMGRPIITTDSVGARETVDHGVNGLLVKPRAVDDLAQAIQWIIEHPDSAKIMGEASRKIATTKYCVHSVNRQILDVMML